MNTLQSFPSIDSAIHVASASTSVLGLSGKRGHLRVLPSRQMERNADEASSLLELTQALLAHLEPSGLLDAFFKRVVLKLSPIAGMEFLSENGQLRLGVGEPAAHRADYRLEAFGSGLGTLTILARHPFDAGLLESCESLLALLVLPLRNALRYHEALGHARRDPLTGLGNRSALDDALRQELSRVRRQAGQLSLVVMDLDLFKQVNDTHGHDVGDALLCLVADALRATLRGSDVACRFGGDEFVVCLPQTGMAGAEAFCNRLRADLATCGLLVADGQRLQVAMSMGMAEYRGGDDALSLFRRADQALYANKAARKRGQASH